MSTKAIKIRPTKVEFIRLKKRHGVAQRVHRILKERLTILVSAMLTLTKDAMAKRSELNMQLELGYQRLMLAYAEKGTIGLGIDAMATQRDTTVTFSTKNIAGVKVPSVESHIELRSPGQRGLTPFDESTSIQDTANHFEKATQLLVDLAQAENNIVRIGMEVRDTRRKVNILEYSVIPTIEETITYLSMKFEEREREEKTRLKKIKKILTSGHKF